MNKEALARIKINKLLEDAGWRFFDTAEGTANIRLEPNVKIKLCAPTGRAAQRMAEVNSIKQYKPDNDSLKTKIDKHDAESIIKNNVRKFKANHKKYNDDYMRFLADPEIDEIIKNSCELKGLDYAETIEKLKTKLAMETIK